MRLLPAFLLLFTLTAAAQQTGQNAPEPSSNAYTMSVTTKLVIETVVVKDKKGNPIDGLTRNDFTVTENGKSGVALKLKDTGDYGDKEFERY